MPVKHRANVDARLCAVTPAFGRWSQSSHLPAWHAMAPATHPAHKILGASAAAKSTYRPTPACRACQTCRPPAEGSVIARQDTDGSITPVDLGMAAVVAKKNDFQGTRSLSRSDYASAVLKLRRVLSTGWRCWIAGLLGRPFRWILDRKAGRRHV